MAARVDPSLMNELKEYGAVDIEKCFNCGNCTAICPLTDDDHPFPRNVIRYMQLGLRDRLRGSLDPWLCYYCGECSDTCPKKAEPAETMMAMRRWLTAQYDWTGLAHKFYTSAAWEIGSMVVVGLVVVLLAFVLTGPVVTEQVELNTFAPVQIVHAADWIMAGSLLFFIGTNVFRMYNMTMRKGTSLKIPLSAYIREAWQFVYHLFTQRRLGTCAEEEKESKGKQRKMTFWIMHLLLVSGYGLMLVLIIFFLPWFQTDAIYPWYHPQRWLGYYATFVLLTGVVYVLWGRVKKDVQIHRFSHPSDWIFPILLLVVTLTGILQHSFRYMGLPLMTYYTYVVHLAFAAPMLILEVPFGKWAHLYYRPLAIYFAAVKKRAAEVEMPAGAVAATTD
ncbi:MAG: 4Fe-4S dicluster domain-containing protein [Anaerolineales bacterium]